MKPILVIYENDIETNKHDQRLVTKAIYFAIFPLMSWKLETDSAWLTELKRSKMLLINSILLSLFVLGHCAPKTLLVETEGEGMADSKNPDEKKDGENENFNKGLENQYRSDGEKSAKDYKQNPPQM